MQCKFGEGEVEGNKKEKKTWLSRQNGMLNKDLGGGYEILKRVPQCILTFPCFYPKTTRLMKRDSEK